MYTRIVDKPNSLKTCKWNAFQMYRWNELCQSRGHNMIQHRLKRYFVYLMVILSCALVFINEFLIYSIYRFGWSSIGCRTANCTTVLFVADPQLLGETFDTNAYSSLAIYDSDRYLKSTFARAFAHSKPNVICFMGDLFDEGSVASDDAYQRYLKRFDHIFRTNGNIVRIHIPGDNDVGGESADYVTAFKLSRFHNAFNETSATVVRNSLRFLNINLIARNYPTLNGSESEKDSALANIVLTHFPILLYPGLTMKKIIDQFRPIVIFSAHTHLSRIITYPPQEVDNVYDNRVVNVKLQSDGRKYTEIMIPTSSYRMGVHNVGYGFAVIDADEIKYTMLWSPNRFRCLNIYGVWFGFVFICILLRIIYQNAFLCRRRVTYRFRQRLMIATDTF